MLARLPSHLPPFADILSDIGQPRPAILARALHVHERTVRRWIQLGEAPYPAMLALYWLTRWGQSLVDATAVNDARLHVQIAECLRREVEMLRARIARLERIGDFGAANDPAIHRA